MEKLKLPDPPVVSAVVEGVQGFGNTTHVWLIVRVPPQDERFWVRVPVAQMCGIVGHDVLAWKGRQIYLRLPVQVGDGEAVLVRGGD